jgi:ABC-type bacteriocin/lantibiotic exporter with double-glycine peptidase domain
MFFFINILKDIIDISKLVKTKLNLVSKISLLTISSVLELVSIALIIPTLLAFFNQEKFLQLAKKYTFLDDQNLFTILLFSLIVFFLFKSLVITLINNYNLKFVFKFQTDLSKTLFKNYLKFDYQDFTFSNSGKLMKNISTESRMFAFILINFFQLYSELIFLLLIFIFLFFVNAKIMFFVTVVSSLFLIFAFMIFRKKLSSISSLRVKNEYGFFKSIKETFENFKLIKIDLKEFFFLNKFSNYSDLNSKYTFKQTFLSLMPKIWIEFIAVLILLTSLLVFQIRDINFNIEVVILLGVYGAALLKVLPSVNRVIYCFQFLSNNSATIKLINSELKKTTIGNDLNNFDIDHSKIKNKISFNKEIELKNIYFKYKNDSNFIFKDLNFKIKKNSTIGIFGQSGRGKTTLIDIVSGLLQPMRGSVEVDGVNIETNLNSWRDKIGYVSQSITVVDDKLERNIAFGLPDDEIDQKKINYSKEIAELNIFNNKKLNQSEIQIMETGSNISGGQLQRLGIARGIYKNAELLIFDEPTSSLDENTANKVIKNIFKLRKNKTIMIISHNMSIISNCDHKYKISDYILKEIE